MRSTAFADAVDRIIALSKTALTQVEVADGYDNPNAPLGPDVLIIGGTAFNPDVVSPAAESVQQKVPGPAADARNERVAIACRLSSNPQSSDRSGARRFVVDQLTLLAGALRDDQKLGGAAVRAEVADRLTWYQDDGVAGPLVAVDFSIIVLAII
jgi:hypothetical protein